MSEQPHRVSVVIATLGGAALARTIEQLNRGTVVPAEILICIPEAEASRVSSLNVANVRVVVTPCRGQVAQRAYGFSQVTSPWVLQVDDDIFLEPDCLEKLLGCLTGLRLAAVGPTMVDFQTGQPSRFMRPRAGSFANRLLFRVVNGADGYQPGRISKSGVNMALADDGRPPYEVDWLPGGCMLHARENLVLKAFYPFPGKAYSEDLFHGALLHQRGVRLIHCSQARCLVDFSSSQAAGATSFARIMFGFSRAMFRFAGQTGRSRVRFALFLPLHVLMLVSHRLTRKTGGASQ
jgi:glycosyltransferase involved in cell wall biosynthesis